MLSSCLFSLEYFIIFSTVQDVCHRWLPRKLLPGSTSPCGRAIPRCYRWGLVLLSCDPNLHTCTGNAETPNHAHSCDLPGPSLRHWGTDQGIQRRCSHSARGTNKQTNSVCWCTFFMCRTNAALLYLMFRWSIITLCPRAGTQSARCPLPCSTLRPVLVAALSIRWDRRWRSQTPSTPHWTASLATMSRRTSGAAWWQSSASSSTPHWSRRFQFIIRCTSVTCLLIKWAIRWALMT